MESATSSMMTASPRPFLPASEVFTEHGVYFVEAEGGHKYMVINSDEGVYTAALHGDGTVVWGCSGTYSTFEYFCSMGTKYRTFPCSITFTQE